MLPTHCKRCGEVLFDEYVSTEEGFTQMKKCVMCGARYFDKSEIQTIKKKCIHCGKEFIVYSPLSAKKVCEECRRKRSLSKKIEKICMCCGNHYIGDPRSKYCKRCVSRLTTQRNAERRRKYAVSL